MALEAKIRTTPGKLYVHIAEILRRRIENCEWQIGERIPTINNLAKEFDVAVVTVRQAVELLEQDGILKRRQGKGTYVEKLTSRKQIWLEMDSTWDALVKKWQGIRPKVLKARDNVNEVPLQEGDGFPVSSYHYMKRLHRAEGVPYALVNIYLDMDIYSRSPKTFDRERVVPNIENLPDISISSAKETLCVGEASAEIADLLDIHLHAPVAEVRRVVRDQKGYVIFVAEAIYRGDVVKLERNFVG